MKYYFTIQFRRFQRLAKEQKLHVVYALVVIILGLLFGLVLLFGKSPYAKFIVIAIQGYALLQFALKSRINFIKKLYKDKEVRIIRLIENVFVSLPFILANALDGNWLLATVQVLIAVSFVFLQSQPLIARTIPTPFRENPFEFTSGFRRLIGYIILGYGICVLGIVVGNINISYFSLMIMWGVMFSFYALPEDISYVRIYNLTAKQFLVEKIKLGFKQSFLLVLPMFLTLIFLDLSQFYIPVIIYLIGILNMFNYIFAKYTDFPGEVALPNGTIVAIAAVMPPLLLFSAIYFYQKAIQNLNTINQ